MAYLLKILIEMRPLSTDWAIWIYALNVLFYFKSGGEGVLFFLFLTPLEGLENFTNVP